MEDGGRVTARLGIQGCSGVRVWEMMDEWRDPPLSIDMRVGGWRYWWSERFKEILQGHIAR